MKFLIMAGGKGSRLWPISRSHKPKQFQKIISDKTMLQETVDRLRSFCNIEDIYVSTNEKYYEEIKEEITDLPDRNIILEPCFRERASSIALACAIIGDSDDSLTILPSDHFIKDEEKFLEVLSEAENFLIKNPEVLLTVGVRPTNPETGYGYIKRKDKTLKDGDSNFYKVEGFYEKPDLETAKKYFSEGNYLWNSAVYICNISSVIDRFKKFIPDTYNRFLKIKNSTEDLRKQIIKEEYPLMDMISFEYGIVENDENVVVVCADFGWSDVGSWSVLKDSLVESKDKNFVKGEHLDIGSKNILVYGSKKMIATIGLEDLVIVDTEDAVLVCNKNETQLVKELVEKMEKNGKIKLL